MNYASSLQRNASIYNTINIKEINKVKKEKNVRATPLLEGITVVINTVMTQRNDFCQHISEKM